jgi:hypothetical protein
MDLNKEREILILPVIVTKYCFALTNVAYASKLLVLGLLLSLAS